MRLFGLTTSFVIIWIDFLLLQSTVIPLIFYSERIIPFFRIKARPLAMNWSIKRNKQIHNSNNSFQSKTKLKTSQNEILGKFFFLTNVERLNINEFVVVNRSLSLPLSPSLLLFHMLHWSAIRLQSSPNHMLSHQSLKAMLPRSLPHQSTKATLPQSFRLQSTKAMLHQSLLHQSIPKPMLHQLTVMVTV